MGTLKRLVLIGAVLTLCVGCDQTTKYMAESYLSTHNVLTFWGDTFRLQLAHNSGAFLGLGSTLPLSIREGFFTLGVGSGLLFLLGYAIFSRSASPKAILACALFFAGGVSNLLDRLRDDGAVIDFMNIGIGSLRTGIFNVADINIMVGALILASSLLRDQTEKTTEH